MENQPEPRVCGNCACFARMLPDGTVLETAAEQGQEHMTVCRRDTPGARWERREVPVIRDGAPVIDRGRPRMEARQVLQIGYRPTVETATCYDGWRKLGTLPGEARDSTRV